MPTKKTTSTSKDLAPKRDKHGYLMKGHTANRNGRPKGGFNCRTWVEAKLKEELPDLVKLAIKEAKEGDPDKRHKVLIFLLSKVLPLRPLLEKESSVILTTSAQQNLINVFQSYNDNKISSQETVTQMDIIQKQVEIQQSDFVKLQNMVEETNKKMEKMMEEMKNET